MSALVRLIDDLTNGPDYYDPSLESLNHKLGLRIRNPEILNLAAPLIGYVRPLRHSHPEDSGVSSVVNDKDGFKVNLDVQQFKPEEIDVKVVDDYLVVEAKHEERKDKHGYISRQFTRKYKLPDNIEIEGLKSSLSSDGILAITAPKKVIAVEGGRQIPIIQTNQPAIKQTKNRGSGDASNKMET